MGYGRRREGGFAEDGRSDMGDRRVREREGEGERGERREAVEGSGAQEPIRGRYLGKDVSKYLTLGGQNPIQYT